MPLGVHMGVAVGSAVSVVISDPFELSRTLQCEIVGVESFHSGVDAETLVVHTPPLAWQGQEYQYLAFRGREAAGILDELGLGLSVECGGIGLLENQFGAPVSLMLDAWRGGLAVRATVTAA